MSGRPQGHFLIVCTANQCRSPLAAAILGAACTAAELDIVVESAGVAAVPGIPVTSQTLDAAASLGLDLSEHRSREVTVEMFRDADLIVTMERRHVQEVVLADSSAFARTFTLKELARRGEDVGPRGVGEPFQEWLARVHGDRRAVDLLGISDEDDIPDPTGNALADHRSTASEIQALSNALLELLWPTR